MVRLLLIGCLLAMVHDYPFRQCVGLLMIIVFNFITIVYTLPYQQFIYNVIMMVNEGCLIIIAAGFTTLSFYDSYFYFLNTHFRDAIGQMICLAILVFLAFNSLIGILMILN